MTSSTSRGERLAPSGFTVERLAGNPIVTPATSPSIGTNINGPSLIEAPPWVDEPLGRYYLYFAHHKDTSIRLAYADELEGPWKIHEGGVLDVSASHFIEHIASPDVHVYKELQQVRMYFHGLIEQAGHKQGTRVATSSDGLTFSTEPELLGQAYFRVFQWDGWHYAWAMPGRFYRSPDGIRDWEPRETKDWPDWARHAAVMLDGATLTVFFTRAKDEPERILCSTVELTPDWNDWTPSPPREVAEPEFDYEGADLGLEVSKYGAIDRRARQLRDPAVFERDGERWLLYSIAGESGIAIARLGGSAEPGS